MARCFVYERPATKPRKCPTDDQKHVVYQFMEDNSALAQNKLRLKERDAKWLELTGKANNVAEGVVGCDKFWRKFWYRLKHEATVSLKKFLEQSKPLTVNNERTLAIIGIDLAKVKREELKRREARSRMHDNIILKEKKRPANDQLRGGPPLKKQRRASWPLAIQSPCTSSVTSAPFGISNIQKQIEHLELKLDDQRASLLAVESTLLNIQFDYKSIFFEIKKLSH